VTGVAGYFVSAKIILSIDHHFFIPAKHDAHFPMKQIIGDYAETFISFRNSL